MHVMLPESSPSSRGPGIATPAGLLPSVIAPHLRSLSSTGGVFSRTDLSATPTGPARGSDTTDSRVAPSPSSMRAAAKAGPGCACRSLPGQWRLPQRTGGSAPAFQVSMLSVHSRCGPHGRWITLGDPFEVLRTMSLPPSSAPIATGWSDSFAGRDSHPLRDGAFPRHTVRNQEQNYLTHSCEVFYVYIT